RRHSPTRPTSRTSRRCSRARRPPASGSGGWSRDDAVMGRGPAEVGALERAKAVLDRFDFYPEKVRIDHVRILHVPLLCRLPWFRRFHGYEMGPLILLKLPLTETSDGLITHELCHVWQDQDHRLRMWWSYVRGGYAENPHEAEARQAGAAA